MSVSADEYKEHRNWHPRRTAEDAFLALPPGYNGRAIANASKGVHFGKTKYESLSTAIISAFSWDETPEGGDFWVRVYSFYTNIDTKQPLPPLPIEEE